MGPKVKQQKMSLADFLSDESTGSWADEVATLPTAPGPRGDNFDDDRRGGRFGSRSYGDRQGGYDRESRGDRFDSRDSTNSPLRERFEQREPRAPVPLPTEPPFTAHIGNLSFDVTEGDLAEFFGEMKISSIRVLRDKDEKPKGFGYIEFEDLESLKSSLLLGNEHLKSRPIRVSIAEPPREREVREDRTSGSSWRRETPLPSGGGGASRGGLADRADRADRPDRGGFRDRFADKPERADRGGPGDRQRDTSWSGGAFSNRLNKDDHPPRDGGFTERGGAERSRDRGSERSERGDWNERRGPSFNGSRVAPAERPRLALQPRTTTPLASPSVETASKSPRSDPFGAAKPIDSEEGWRRTEERRKQREAAKKAEEEQGSNSVSADVVSESKPE